jgi:hypothetical protein
MEAVMALSGYYLGNFLEELRRTTKISVERANAPA